MNGVDQISVPKNALLKFSHPQMDEDLFIRSGATSIKWSYQLNTQSTPTVGGEVIQILSCFVGPITITGQTAGLKTNKSGNFAADEVHGWLDEQGKKAYGPNHELRDIVSWFRSYMKFAGTDTGVRFRDERAVYFEYAERGWNFRIQPTVLQGFRYDKNIISPEWSITAEIVSNNALDFFSGTTMSSFTDDLLTTNTNLQGQIGLSAFADSKAQINNPNFGQTGDFGSTNPFLNPELGMDATTALKRMGDNFQGLVAAWSSGDFAHFGFGALLDNNALPKSVDKALGNSILAGLPGWGGSSGSGGSSGTGSFTYSGSNTQDSVAVQIANAFSANNLPPELGIAVALHESALNPDCVQGSNGNAVTNGGVVIGDGAIGLFQTFYASLQNGGAGAGAGQAHAQEIKQAQAPLTLGQAVPKGYSVLHYYPTAHQAEDASNWFAPYAKYFPGSSPSNDQLARWANSAQGVSVYTDSDNKCSSQFANDLSQAKSILKQLTHSTTTQAGFACPFPDGWVPNRLDQGYDGTFTNVIVAPFDGTITYAGYIGGSNPWGGYIQIQADTKPAGIPTKTLYFAEGLKATISQGQHVTAGTTIAKRAPSPYGNSYGTTSDGSGQIEWGVAADGSVGLYTGPYAGVLGLGTQPAANMVLSFAQWAKDTLDVKGNPTDISHAGNT